MLTTKVITILRSAGIQVHLSVLCQRKEIWDFRLGFKESNGVLGLV